MSFAFGVVLMCSAAEEDDGTGEPRQIQAINEWLRLRAAGSLTMVQDHFGGFIGPGIYVAGAGFPHVDIEGLIEQVLKAAWDWPEDVLLMVRTTDTPPRVYRVGGEPHFP